MSSFNLRSFTQRARRRKTLFRRFLTRLEKRPPKMLDQLTGVVEQEVWREINCINCANCCKVMTPTYTSKDMKRISRHFGMTVQQLKDKWLHKEEDSGDWMNRNTPCQFLEPATNMCTIYDVRPADCAGFPHLPKKKMVEYSTFTNRISSFAPRRFDWLKK